MNTENTNSAKFHTCPKFTLKAVQISVRSNMIFRNKQIQGHLSILAKNVLFFKDFKALKKK